MPINLQSALDELRDRGFVLSAEGDMIRFRAPRGVRTDRDIEFLATYKAPIIDLFKTGNGNVPKVIPAVHTHPISNEGGESGLESAEVQERQHQAQVHRLAARSPSRRPSRLGITDPELENNSRNSRNSPSASLSDNFANITNRSGDLEPGPEALAADAGDEGRMVVRISDRTFDYSHWDGEKLTGDFLGFDTETALIQDHEIPGLALASASDGTTHHLIHPLRVGEFILAHEGRNFIFHNVAFDFWVVADHLELRGEDAALKAWWAIADDDRMHDTMLLDQLIRLARDDAYPRPRNLAEVAREYAGLVVDKTDPFRLRYGEIIGHEWSLLDPGFFNYAIKDPIVTLAAYQTMADEAANLMENHAPDLTDALDRFWVLSEAIQVKASITLAAIGRRGINVDQARLDVIRANLLRRQEEAISGLSGLDHTGDLFRLDKAGKLVLTPKGKAPSFSQDRLRTLLGESAAAVAKDTGRPVLVSRTVTGKVSLATDQWEEIAPFAPLVAAWIELSQVNKNLQFFCKLEGSTVYPRYTPMVRTGRTSCSDPNIQNLPRKGGFREAFVPRAGYVFLIVDYAYIELRTLAAELLSRYGSSKLAEVIKAGIDPHCFTAAMFEGMEPNAFLTLAKSEHVEDRERYDTLRQRAKVLNFGIPGGLGAASLVSYARSTYGVMLTLEQASKFRDRLIQEVYPELGVYLADDAMTSLARNLGVSVDACWKRFDRSDQRSGQVAGAVKKVVQGRAVKADGSPYKPRFVESVWDGLIALNRQPELTSLLADRRGSEELRARLFDSAVTTLTGRIRGRVRFTQAKNTPFQGLAADGAKLALWDLMRAGYRVVAFIHDEVIIEIPEGDDHAAEALRVEKIMNRAMEIVTGEVPVAVEYALCRRWSKKAKAVFDAQGHLIPCEID